MRVKHGRILLFVFCVQLKSLLVNSLPRRRMEGQTVSYWLNCGFLRHKCGIEDHETLVILILPLALASFDFSCFIYDLT